MIDFSWTMRGNHVLKVVAHATAPMSVDAGFRQYDFFVDGRSFFTFPKVYRLGLTGGKTLSPDGAGKSRMAESSERRSANIATIEAPHNPDEVGFISIYDGELEVYFIIYQYIIYLFIILLFGCRLQ